MLLQTGGCDGLCVMIWWIVWCHCLLVSTKLDTKAYITNNMNVCMRACIHVCVCVICLYVRVCLKWECLCWITGLCCFRSGWVSSGIRSQCMLWVEPQQLVFGHWGYPLRGGDWPHHLISIKYVSHGTIQTYDHEHYSTCMHIHRHARMCSSVL